MSITIQLDSPEALTVKGKAMLVVQDAKSYRAMLATVQRAEAIARIQRGLDSVRRGEGESASQVFARIRRKFRVGER